jgi:hypothetical protein
VRLETGRVRGAKKSKVLLRYKKSKVLLRNNFQVLSFVNTPKKSKDFVEGQPEIRIRLRRAYKTLLFLPPPPPKRMKI